MLLLYSTCFFVMWLTWCCNDTTRWRQQSTDIAKSVDRKTSHIFPVMCCAWRWENLVLYTAWVQIALILMANWDEVSVLAAAVCPLSEGAEAVPHAHPLFSICSGKITPFTDTLSSRHHVLVLADTLLCTFPSQSAHPVREGSVCLNLLFVMQVISEEGVSFKVSLFSRYLSPFSLFVSLSCLYLSIFRSFCDVIPWWFCLWLFVLSVFLPAVEWWP